VSQHGDLEFRLGRHAVVRTDQTEDPAQEEIEERADHGAAFSQTGRRCRSQHEIVFLDPTGLPMSGLIASERLVGSNQVGFHDGEQAVAETYPLIAERC
jgi:hypothetical protein